MEDWSLDGKTMGFVKIYYPTEHREYYYFGSDIETLRKKLILKYKKGELNEETINKLFGM